jgi:hypothetical protein
MRQVCTVMVMTLLAACGGEAEVQRVDAPLAGAEASPHAGSDSAFEALQERGAGPLGMGVDQYASTHQFDILPDGGRIELQHDTDDAAAIARIREHLQEITRAFAAGDFSTPAFVHMQQVPGTDVMAAKRDVIEYDYRQLPRGGEVTITSTDAEALDAIRRFMEFQRADHRASGHGH